MNVTVNIPTNGTRDEAKEKLVANIKSVDGLVIQPAWVADYQATLSMSYSGFATSGKIKINDDFVWVEVQIPRIARRWAPMIEKTVQEKLGKILA